MTQPAPDAAQRFNAICTALTQAGTTLHTYRASLTNGASGVLDVDEVTIATADQMTLRANELLVAAIAGLAAVPNVLNTPS